MTCKTLYDIKKVAYQYKAYTVDAYMDAIGDDFQEILAQKDGFTLETKGEVAEYTVLNGVRSVDSERIPLRINGSLKFTKNVDTALIDNHLVLVNAGLGKVSAGAVTSIVALSGTGDTALPFLTTLAPTVAVGDIIYHVDYGFKAVTTIDTTGPVFGFTIDVPVTTTVSNKTFAVFKGVDLTNPLGTCDNVFNFVVSLADDSFVELMGCNIKCDFALTMEKQLLITFNVTSPEVITIDTTDPTGWDSITPETKGTPVICSFSQSLVVTAGTAVSYFPPVFDLGFSITEEPLKTYGGRNNLIGYINRSSIKSKISFDRTSVCKGWVASPRTGRSYSMYQSNFGLYIAKGYLTLVDQSVANGNHDTIACEMDNNSEAAYKVYLVLP